MQQGVGGKLFYQQHLTGQFPGAVGQVQVFWPDAEDELAEVGPTGRGADRGRERGGSGEDPG